MKTTRGEDHAVDQAVLCIILLGVLCFVEISQGKVRIPLADLHRAHEPDAWVVFTPTILATAAAHCRTAVSDLGWAYKRSLM